jgi:mono/diheme cytochrome c family protein
MPVVVALLTGAAVGAVRAQAPPRSVKEGVYTPAQAQQGKILYDQKCASCHGSMASATPDMAPLLNDYVFQAAWNGRSLGDLFDRIRNTMPQNEPGTLSPQHTADIVAYLLSANQLPPGSAALDSDVEALKEIRFDTGHP